MEKQQKAVVKAAYASSLHREPFISRLATQRFSSVALNYEKRCGDSCLSCGNSESRECLRQYKKGRVKPLFYIRLIIIENIGHCRSFLAMAIPASSIAHWLIENIGSTEVFSPWQFEQARLRTGLSKTLLKIKGIMREMA